MTRRFRPPTKPGTGGVGSGDVGDAQAQFKDGQTSLILDSVEDPLISELLTEHTRDCRKSLLLVSTVCLAVTWGGLFPSELDFQGFKVSKLERTNLLYLLAAIVGYYMAAFIAYCYSDHARRAVRTAIGRVKSVPEVNRVSSTLEAWPKPGEGEAPIDEAFFESPEFKSAALVSDHIKLVKRVLKASSYRMLIDVYLPAVIALVAVTVVLSEAGGLPSLGVLIGLSVLVLVVAVGMLVQSRWLRSKLFLWRFKVGVAILKKLVPFVEKSKPGTWRRRLVDRIAESTREWMLKKTKKTNREDPQE